MLVQPEMATCTLPAGPATMDVHETLIYIMPFCRYTHKVIIEFFICLQFREQHKVCEEYLQ